MPKTPDLEKPIFMNYSKVLGMRTENNLFMRDWERRIVNNLITEHEISYDECSKLARVDKCRNGRGYIANCNIKAGTFIGIMKGDVCEHKDPSVNLNYCIPLPTQNIGNGPAVYYVDPWLDDETCNIAFTNHSCTQFNCRMETVSMTKQVSIPKKVSFAARRYVKTITSHYVIGITEKNIKKNEELLFDYNGGGKKKILYFDTKENLEREVGDRDKIMPCMCQEGGCPLNRFYIEYGKKELGESINQGRRRGSGGESAGVVIAGSARDDQVAVNEAEEDVTEEISQPTLPPKRLGIRRERERRKELEEQRLRGDDQSSEIGENAFLSSRLRTKASALAAVPITRSINDYCGVVLNKKKYFTEILSGGKIYECRSIKRVILPPKIVFHPSKALRDSRKWTQNIEAFISAECRGPFNTLAELSEATNGGRDLGMTTDELDEFVTANDGKEHYLYPIYSATVSDIIWIDSPSVNQNVFSRPTYMKMTTDGGRIKQTLFYFPGETPLQEMVVDDAVEETHLGSAKSKQFRTQKRKVKITSNSRYLNFDNIFEPGSDNSLCAIEWEKQIDDDLFKRDFISYAERSKFTAVVDGTMGKKCIALVDIPMYTVIAVMKGDICRKDDPDVNKNYCCDLPKQDIGEGLQDYYLDSSKWLHRIKCNSAFINHSCKNYNCSMEKNPLKKVVKYTDKNGKLVSKQISGSYYTSTTLHDIKKGEELFSNYDDDVKHQHDVDYYFDIKRKQTRIAKNLGLNSESVKRCLCDDGNCPNNFYFVKYKDDPIPNGVDSDIENDDSDDEISQSKKVKR